jgi:hypothetical protein
MGASILGFGRVVANPDITPTFEFCPCSGYSTGTRNLLPRCGFALRRFGVGPEGSLATRAFSGLMSLILPKKVTMSGLTR